MGVLAEDEGMDEEALKDAAGGVGVGVDDGIPSTDDFAFNPETDGQYPWKHGGDKSKTSSGLATTGEFADPARHPHGLDVP